MYFCHNTRLNRLYGRSSILPRCQHIVAVRTRRDAEVAFERFAQGNLRVMPDEPGDLRELPRASPQIGGSFREPPASDVAQWRFAHQLPELRRKCGPRQTYLSSEHS